LTLEKRVSWLKKTATEDREARLELEKRVAWLELKLVHTVRVLIMAITFVCAWMAYSLIAGFGQFAAFSDTNPSGVSQ
jgi:hypothetical protein